MFRKLRIQLTLFCTAVISTIIILMSVLCLYIAETNFVKNNYTSFLNNLNSVYSYIAEQSTLSVQWLNQVEASNHFMIHITDNGIPLFSHLPGKSNEESQAIEKAMKIAAEDYGIRMDAPAPSSTLPESHEFTIKGKQGEYYASVKLIPKSEGYMGVLILFSKDQLNYQLFVQRSAYLLIALFAIALLGIFFWFFTARMIQPIETSRKQQTQFIAAASHELRSPLSVILSSVSAWRSAPPKDQPRFIESIESEGRRMNLLITEMLSLANADAQAWEMNYSMVMLDTILLDAYEKYEYLAEKKQIRLTVALPDDEVPAFRGDRARIFQVLSILIDNALSYTPKGGKIQLSLELEGMQQILKVSDNGPGVSDDDKPHIFQRFYRAEPFHSSKNHFGLGLCIADEIVKLHKGELFIEDTPGGRRYICDDT